MDRALIERRPQDDLDTVLATYARAEEADAASASEPVADSRPRK
jgi:hypothetical protein